MLYPNPAGEGLVGEAKRGKSHDAVGVYSKSASILRLNWAFLGVGPRLTMTESGISVVSHDGSSSRHSHFWTRFHDFFFVMVVK